MKPWQLEKGLELQKAGEKLDAARTKCANRNDTLSGILNESFAKKLTSEQRTLIGDWLESEINDWIDELNKEFDKL